MANKTITLIAVSDRKGITRKWTVSSAWLKTVGVFAVVGGVLLAALLIDYVGLLIQSSENKRLRAENIQLKNQFSTVESKVVSLESEMERVRTFSAKLRLITETNSDDKALRLSMNSDEFGLEANGEMMEDGPAVDREPASHIAREDSLFFKKPPLDMKNGELASEEDKGYAKLSIRLDKAIKDSELRQQGILELWEGLSQRQSLLRATPSVPPANGWFTSGFGYRVSPYTGKATLHQGLDIAALPGTPVRAPADGLVTYTGYDPGYGKLVSIDHGYGISTRFGHNSQIFVVVGQRVRRGDVISAVGNTGRATGPHVHYEVRLNSVPVDPRNYILTDF
ncbi:MAG: M23 family metallopeptidase [Bdellovibrionales bacterium]|nr:M23 family metallopeptidase [Bdellovibrionales bacterium]